ncbi:MAG: tetratricopeptide repeat protein [bacterium]
MIADERGLALSGADAAQAAAFDAVVRDYLDYRLSAFPALKALCAQAPEFAMAHIFKGFLLLSMGTREIEAAARACHRHVSARAEALTARERCHLCALAAWARGDTVGACACWDEAMLHAPLDLLALRLQHFALFWLGAAERMRDAAARVLPAWGEDAPGYAHVLGVYAFALEETHCYARAERLGREAVERHPDDLWSLHAVVHVYEMQGRLSEGALLLDQPLDRWHDRNPFQGHLWWHAALFAFERGAFERALALYDSAVRPAESDFYLDLQNTASLLARLQLAGIDVGARWGDLADAVRQRIGDYALVFTEPHCAMAFGHAGRVELRAQHLDALRDLAMETGDGNGDGNSSAPLIAPLVEPLCIAIGDFCDGDHAAAADALLALRYDCQSIGGSHAQRDVFNLYLIAAAERAQNLELARALLTERVARYRNSYPSWQRYAEICERLGDRKASAEAREELKRIAEMA